MKRIVRVNISAMLIILLCMQSFVCFSQTTQSTVYSDINEHWAKDQITKMINLGYVKGVATNDGIKIQPDRNITRAEFVAVMVKILKAQAVSGKIKSFSDVKSDAWYKNIVDIASSNDLIGGYPNGTFKPNSNISRSEIAQLISKLCKLDLQSETGEKSFPDVKKSDWFYKQVMLCKKNNIISGYPDNTFRPLNSATRAEAFSLLGKSLSFLAIVNDDEEIPGGPATTVVSNKTPTPTSISIPSATPIPTNNSGSSSGKSSGGGTTSSTPTTYAEGSIYFIEPQTLTVSDSVYIKGRTMDIPSIKSIECIINYTDDEGSNKSQTSSVTEYKSINKQAGVYEFELSGVKLPSFRNEIQIVITDKNGRTHTGTKVVSVNIDTDGDGLLDAEEAIAGTSRSNSDTDGDGLSDYEELEVYLTNPLSDDTDEDGLGDWAELCPWKATKAGGVTKVTAVGKPGEEVKGAFFISPFKADTDEDGLSDYYEVIELGTNPSDIFTLDNPYRDADMDFDNDGLTNMEELNAGTEPLSEDTDKDGLTDGAEIKKYSTDPLNPDSDGDGLYDGDEVEGGSDPLNIFSFSSGILDSLAAVTENVYRDKFDDGISSVSDTIELISIEGAPNAGKSLSVQEIVYMSELSNIEGIIGKPIDISCEANINSAKLTFKISKDTLAKHDLKNLKVFTIYEGKLSILDTEYDADSSTISASTPHFSIYGIVDIYKLIASLLLGDDERGGIIDKGKADVVFAIDSTGSMSEEINNVIKNVSAFSDELSKNVEVRFGLIDYKDIYEDGEASTVNCGWYTDVDDFKKRVAKIFVTGGGDAPESAVDALEEARTMGFRPNANKFIIVLTDNQYKNGTRFKDVETMEQEIELLKNGGIITSVVGDLGYESTYKDLYAETDGLFADINSDFATVLSKLSSKIKEVTLDGTWIRLSDLSVVKLDKAPDKSDLKTDTDKDGLPDSVELDCELAVSISSHEINTWSYFTNPVIKDSTVKIRNITVTPKTGKAGQNYTISADMFSPEGSKKVSYAVIQFKLGNGKWITLDSILSNKVYRDKFAMDYGSRAFNGSDASVDRFEKSVKILDAGKRVFKITAKLSDGTVVESYEHTIVVDADGKLVWKGIDTSKTAVVGGKLNLNVSLKGDVDVIKNLQVFVEDAKGAKEIYSDLVGVIPGTTDYTLTFDTALLDNNKNYKIEVVGLNASGEVILVTPVYNVIVKNVIAAPEINPTSGSYSGDIKVSMSTKISGGVIRYTLDGSEPTALSSVYNDKDKLLIKSSKYDVVVLKAAAFKGSEKSSVTKVEYSFKKDTGWNFAEKEFEYLTGSKYNNTSKTDANRVFTDKMNAINTQVAQVHAYSNEKSIIRCAENQDKVDTLIDYLISSYDKYFSKEIKAGAKSGLESKRSQFSSNHASMERYVIELLTWDQKKYDKFYELVQAYNIRGFKVDERFLIPIIIAEGTGSFNTYDVIKATDGESGTNINFENDVQHAVQGQAIAKLSTYAHYGEQYRSFINGLNQTNYTDISDVNSFKEGGGRVAQYLNSRAPKMESFEEISGSPAITKITGHGVYATNYRWWYNVESTFNQLVTNNGTGNMSEKYSQYLLNNEIPLKSGYDLPTCKFSLTGEGAKYSSSGWLKGRPCIQISLSASSSGGGTGAIGLKFPYKQGDKGPEITMLQKALDSRVDTSASEVMIKNNTPNYTENFASLTNALVVLYQKQLALGKASYPSYSSKIAEALNADSGEVNQSMMDLLNDSDFTFKIKDPAGKKGQFKLNSSKLWEFVEDETPETTVPIPTDPSGFKVYLSPSMQIHNIGVGEYGTEYDRMSDVADVVQKILTKNGITVYRNNKEWRLLSQNAYINKIVNDSNSKKPNVHFAVHSNANDDKSARGMEIYYKPNDSSSKELAQSVESNVYSICPDDASKNWRRGIKEGSAYSETTKINAATNLIEIAFHTNESDVKWIIDNTEEIGEEIAEGIMEYLGVK